MGQHQQDTVVILDDFQVIVISLLPGRLQGQAERPVDFAAPEGMQDHLFAVRRVQGIVKVFDQQMMPVRQVGPGRFLLSLQKIDELIGRGLIHEIFPAQLLFQRRCVESALEFFQKEKDLFRKQEIPVQVFGPPEGDDAGLDLGRQRPPHRCG